MHRKKIRRPLLKDKRLILIKREASKSTCLKLKPSAQIPWVLALTNFLNDLTNDPNHMGQERSPQQLQHPFLHQGVPKGSQTFFLCSLSAHRKGANWKPHVSKNEICITVKKKKKKKPAGDKNFNSLVINKTLKKSLLRLCYAPSTALNRWCCSLVSCVWLFCNPIDCSSPGSSVLGISRARTVEWATISFARGCSRTRDWTHFSCTGRRILYHWAILGIHQ